MAQETRCALSGTSRVGCTRASHLLPGRPRSRAKDQQRRDCQVWQAIIQPAPVRMMRVSSTMAPARDCRAWLKSSRMGTSVGVLKRALRSFMEKNMAMEKGQAVVKPMATVPIMAMGMRRSGWWISSAM